MDCKRYIYTKKMPERKLRKRQREVNGFLSNSTNHHLRRFLIHSILLSVLHILTLTDTYNEHDHANSFAFCKAHAPL